MPRQLRPMHHPPKTMSLFERLKSPTVNIVAPTAAANAPHSAIKTAIPKKRNAPSGLIIVA
jgi:hypothetical protein